MGFIDGLAGRDCKSLLQVFHWIHADRGKGIFYAGCFWGNYGKRKEKIRTRVHQEHPVRIDSLAPQVGLEPTTTRLTAECSAIELLRNMESGGDLCSRAVSSQVRSALRGLTSVFGMGTGGTLSSLPPEMVSYSVAGEEAVSSSHGLPLACACFFPAFPRSFAAP